jgi:hypothetical protein
MVRGSLGEEGVASWRGFHDHGRPCEQGGAAARGKKKGREWLEWRKEWRV